MDGDEEEEKKGGFVRFDMDEMVRLKKREGERREYDGHGEEMIPKMDGDRGPAWPEYIRIGKMDDQRAWRRLLLSLCSFEKWVPTIEKDDWAKGESDGMILVLLYSV